MLIQETPQRSKEIEKAIKFLVHAFDKSECTGKPVILHSIRVGLYLNRQGYDKNIVIAGILHDLLEDSNTTVEEIKKKFGDNVAKLVMANSFDKDIKDKRKRYFQTYERCIKAGKDALVIKTSDILDNYNYYDFAEGEELRKWLLEKMKHFIYNTAEIIGKENIWKELKDKYIQLSK